MKSRVIKILLFLIFISSALYAGDFSVNLSLGYRERVTTEIPTTMSLTVDVDDFLFSTQLQPDDYSIGVGYNLRCGKTISNIIYLHSLYDGNRGGYTDLSYIFRQDFSWKYFSMFYGFGIQVGLAYSHYVESPLVSLSPLVHIGFDIKLNPVILSFGLGLNNRLERSWKALPIYEAKIEYVHDEHSCVILSGFLREAEYWMDPWHMIDAYGVSFSYVYRGDL